MFINEISREYQFYNIIATVTASPIVATLTFVSRARESVQKELAIKNPLSNESLFFIRCEQLQCPDVLTINRKSEVILKLVRGQLSVSNLNLDSFHCNKSIIKYKSRRDFKNSTDS